MKVPDSLFKYFPPARAIDIERCELAFSRLSSFNDPFEGRPEVTGLATPNLLKEKFLSEFQATIKRRYPELPCALRAQFSFKQFEQMMWETARERLDDEITSLKPQIDSLAKEFPDRLDSEIGVLCLSEQPDNLLMWAHYAQSHTGFVVEFDTANPFFSSKKSDKDEFRHLRQVEYRHTRPSSNLVEMQGPEFFLVKSKHWIYEQEWRMLLPLGEADRCLHLEEGDVHLKSFPPSAVKSIIVGSRASLNTQQLLKAAHESTFNDSTLWIAYPDQSTFSILKRAAV